MVNALTNVQRVTIYALFVLSGASGLVYEVIWVRQFGMVFGNTVHSASLVTAVFTLGLGLGAFVVGKAADRRHGVDVARSLRAYGLSELVIAALGLALLVIIPRLAPIIADLSHYAVGADGWSRLDIASHAVRYGIAIGLILPITFLMGGTLTLLIRATVGADIDEAGARIGVLYAVNTAGAALGCLLTDFALVPAIGVTGTVVFAIALNVLAGGGALALGRAARAAPQPLSPPASEPSTGPGGRTWAPALALFCSGFAALGLEIVWFRDLSSALGKSRAVFSLLLAVVLTGIWVGSLTSGALLRRGVNAHRLYAIAQAAFVVTGVALVALVDPRTVIAALAQYGGSTALNTATPSLLIAVGVVVGIPSLCMGFSYPCANAVIHHERQHTGTRAGVLYFANTAGNVVGAVSAGFLLLPMLGVETSLVVCGLAAALSIIVVLQLGRDGGRPDVVIAVAFVSAGVALAMVSRLPDYTVARRTLASFPRDQQHIIAIDEGANETLVIVEGNGFRRLYTDGHPMSSSTWGAQRYMRFFSHLPLLELPRAERMLVICFGVGNTTHAASLHPELQRLDVADLSEGVLQHADYFAATNEGVIHDPRVHVYVNDGRSHLAMVPPNTYDVVTLEPPPLNHAGVSALYSREFYALARSRLTDGGMLTQWLPANQVQPEAVLAMVRAFIDVFPHAVMYEPSWKQFVLVGRASDAPYQLNTAAVDAAIAARPRVQADLAYLELDSSAVLASLIVADADGLRRAAAEAAPLSDDHPINEYATPGLRDTLPPALFTGLDAAQLAAFCPPCASAPAFADVPATVAMLGRMRQGDDYLISPQSHPSGEGFLLTTSPEEDAIIARSRYLTATIMTPTRWARRAEWLRTQGRLREADEVAARGRVPSTPVESPTPSSPAGVTPEGRDHLRGPGPATIDPGVEAQ